MTRARILVVLCLLTVVPSLTHAQATTGTPPFGSFGGGPDVINLANLNSHLDIPVVNKAGRGTNFTYDLSYDSSVWYPVTSGSTTSWQPVPNWGWRGITEVATGYISYRTTTRRDACFDSNINKTLYFNVYVNGQYVYHDSWGVPHPFTGTSSNGYSYDDVCYLDPWYEKGVSNDGSGFSINQDSNTGNYLITSRTGQVINAPVNLTSGSGQFTDRNGNQITVNSGGNFYDTLSSNTPVLAVAGSGTPTSPITFTYTAPSGASAAYTMKYTAYTVQTKFGCATADYGPISNNLVSEIDLPDGSKYSFIYEGTPGVSGNVTGRLKSVTLPTGGTITYTYTGGSSGGISCPDGSAATLTRATPDGTWTYGQVKGTGAASTTTVTDPQGNVTTIQFQGIYETQRQVYQGSASGTLLLTTNTCYNGATSPCTSTAVTAQITNRTVITTLPNNLQSKHFDSYNTYGVPTESDDYDYGSGTPGTLLRKTLITYASLTNINAFQQTVTVYNGAGTQVSQTKYNYDETAVTASPGTPPQHTTVSGSRGNLTSINYPVSGLTSHSAYYDTGAVKTATDVNGAAVTTFNYPDATSTCGYSFPASVTEPMNMSRSMTWNCTGGVLTSLTDENTKTTSYTFNDPDFWRIGAITDPLGNQKSYGYQPNPTYCCPPVVAWAMTFNNGNSVVSDWQYQDALGRPFVDQHRQNPSSSTLDSISYTYDSNGRLYSVSTPCSISWAQTCSTPKTTQTYDVLNRPLVTTDGGGGTVSYTYTGNDVLLTIGPAPSGENTKRRQFEYDALGRLTSICEITSASGSGACGQNVPQNGFWTTYAYTFDSQAHPLLKVTQNAQSPTGSQQVRSYTYDAMNRLISETNPESGTTLYAYDSVSGTYCTPNSPGDLIKRTDANGNWTCYNYDALHRLTDIGNNNQSASNPARRFRYDNTTGVYGSRPSGVTVNNVMGRLVEAETDDGREVSPITDEWFSYTARGEVSDAYQSSPSSGGYYHSTATYWANGVLNQLTGTNSYSAGWNVDGEGRVYSNFNTGGNPLSSTIYNAAGQPTQLNFASSDSDTYTYDPNTGRMTQYQFNVNGSALTGTLGWNANGTLQTQNITDAFNSADTQNCSYSYDDLVRLANANCGSAAAQTFSFDAFGNISKMGSPYSFTPTYSSATNRMASINGFAPSYDNNGNVTNDSLHTYTWDTYNRPVTIDSVNNLTYDAFGRMVEQNRSGVYTEFAYSPTGFKMEIMKGQAAQKAFAPLPAGAMAVYDCCTITYTHADWLGSTRLGSTPSRTMSFDVAYAPFGETYASSGSTDPAFTSQRQDTVGGLYDFPAREYSIQGRWPSPDPAGLAAVDPSNPQSWNRYAYVANDPLDFIDPQGLDRSTDCGGPCFDFALDLGLGCYAWVTYTDVTDSTGTWAIPSIGPTVCPGSSSGSSSGRGLPKKVKAVACSIIPDGRAVGLTASAGTLGGATGGAEVVFNYNTGEVSGFGYAGGFAGFNGGGSASATGGLIFNLGNSNSNYSGPFTTVGGSVGPFGAFLSLSGTPNSLSLSQPKVVGMSAGASMFGPATGTVAVTKYSSPQNLGNFAKGTAPDVAGEVDYLFYLVRRVCQ